MKKLTHLTILNLFFISISILSNGANTDTLTQQKPITESQTLLSKSHTFELGFFSPPNSNTNLLYLGIWYSQISPKTIVWVANRNSPIPTSPVSSVSLHLNHTGNIVLLDQNQNPIWGTSSDRYLKPGRPIAQLLDSGNLVIREEIDENPENYLWQSFDYPTNTLLPGMKLGWDLKTGRDRFLTSWRKAGDPSVGEFSFVINRNGSPEVYLFKGESLLYRSGPWNGVQFSGVPEMESSEDLRFEFVDNATEISYSFSTLRDELSMSRLVLDELGIVRRLMWLNRTQKWSTFWFAPKDQCDDFGACGGNGICDSNRSPVCKCPKGFEPRNQVEWDLRDGTDGCVRRRKEEVDCREGNVGFLKLERMKLAVSERVFVDSKMGLKECEERCRRNCSCTGFANSDIRGRGCIMWSGDLIDMREYSYGGQDLYVRVDASELKKNRRPIYIIVAVAVSLTILLLALSACLMWKCKIAERWWKRKDGRVAKIKSQEMPLFVSSSRECLDDSKKDDLELHLFDFDTITSSTNNFSEANKLGQGGFGCVYKGILADGQQIAVKRLSMNSGQGVEEFKNEVTLIARLQHRNLVRLLGCSVEEKENLLIYEYMENRSLDSILFGATSIYEILPDKTRNKLLDWPKRFNIILGTARGLLYLHQDSRFRIIHRDLKASNILLDGEMNPKISDFGMARIFGGDQTEANTRRVVGTYGYMSPEYAMDGIFSVKSDVFSYGVLLLEIVSGKKNQGFYLPDSDLNLLGHTWNLWEEGKGLDLMDTTKPDSYSATEVLKCIHIGLLCVQERAEDRPTMDSVVLMLNSEVPKLLQPKQPGFCLGKTPTQQDTVNQVTVTVMQPRYVGIWFKNITQTVVWVANREDPLTDSSGVLTARSDGNIVILNGSNRMIWFSNLSTEVKNPVAQLLTTGNLVIKDGNEGNSGAYIWQSFDHPCNTLLLGVNNSRHSALTSWKSADDPSIGDFSYGVEYDGLPQLILKQGSIKRFRSGPWNGLLFSGLPFFLYNPVFNPSFGSAANESGSVSKMIVLNQSGLLQRFTWNDQRREWTHLFTVPEGDCDRYGHCGANSICSADKKQVCECLQGFTPKSPQAWQMKNWSDGCIRRTQLDCGERDGFLPIQKVKLPDVLRISTMNLLSLDECKLECLKNCSCAACANSDFSEGGRGCVLWFGDLIDIRQITDVGVQDLHLRLSASDLVDESQSEDLDLPLFDWSTMVTVTSNFSYRNKIGEGGFGPVYKGVLVEGQEIAVKRLSIDSGQGITEFKNEVSLISNLQHRNLVKLLGCCIHRNEKLLIYEYMPNKSLEQFIYDKERSNLLDWQKRFNIIMGIARGLLYLHQDSRLRIIHRDLKTSNILLDGELNPKISDFGMARIFGGDQTEAKTKRVVGTYGYMSPEYALEGFFSTKSDVFSFGVVMLEIVSGKKNRGFGNSDEEHNLLGNTWMLWGEGVPLKIMDTALEESCIPSEVLKCIQVGLLCVQQLPKDRPSMASVVSMLSSETASLPQPILPGYFTETSIDIVKEESHSENGVTITLLGGR
ncbi:hypothetical protein Syun_010401 [Stephania yunnanensis]|uniref:non-specific serine/threonine protein kinase n=1 Tax=Stephania yunnanensis TaxID=152371 RepID=A0AAP0PPY3_9MAGN